MNLGATRLLASLQRKLSANLLAKLFAPLVTLLVIGSCAKKDAVLTQTASSTSDSNGNTSKSKSQLGHFDVLGQILELPYIKVNDVAVVGGDIILPLRSLKSETPNGLSLAGVNSQALWPSRNIPYVFANGFRFVAEFNQVAAEWASKTPVRFVPRTNETAYLVLTNTAMPGYDTTHVCGYSFLGLINANQPQDVFINPTCTTLYRTISHELGHAVGISHEHQRWDRDNFVTFYPENAVGGLEGNWDKVSSIQRFSDYDTYSVMHYESFAGAKVYGQPVWRRKDGSLIESSNFLSVNDVRGITNMYSDKRCEINMTLCSKPEKLGMIAGRLIFSDSDPGAIADPARCKQRAKEFSDYCENAPSYQTWSTHVENGVQNKAHLGYWFSLQMGCQVYITQCDNGAYSSNAGILDAHQNAPTDETRCFARAKEYSDACRKTNGTITASFYKAGAAGLTTKTYNAVPFGCSVTTTYSCRNDPQTSQRTFMDNFENADTNSDKCLARAKQFSDYCDAPEGKTTSVKFYDGSLREAVFVAPYRGCALVAQTCRNAAVTAGQKQYFGIASSEGASFDSCRLKAKSLFETCGNTLEDLVSGTFYDGGEVSPVTFGKVIQGCQISVGTCPAFPKLVEVRFNDTFGGANESKDVCFANARVYHATCQKPSTAGVSATFTSAQGLTETSLEVWKGDNQ